jgi:hypothetical protein
MKRGSDCSILHLNQSFRNVLVEKCAIFLIVSVFLTKITKSESKFSSKETHEMTELNKEGFSYSK